MSSSLIYTNAFFFTFSAVIMLYLIDKPALLTYKKGIPIFSLLVLILLRLIIPGEFFFTTTIPSKNILTFINNIEQLKVVRGFSLIEIVIFIWFSISSVLLIRVLCNHRRFMKIISLLPRVKEKEVVDIFSNLCKEQNLRKVPKLVRFNSFTTPTIVGFKNPIIVIPNSLSKDEIRFALLHELEHYKHHHLLLKIFVEIAFILYWWHPLMWILKMSFTQALELQADAYATSTLSKEDTFAYTKALVSITDEQNSKQTAFSMAFAINMGFTKKRISSLTESIRIKRPTILLKQKLLVLISVAILLLSAFFTFEASHIDSEVTKGTITVNSSNTYFLEIQDGKYEFYINGNYVSTMENIPDWLSDFPVNHS